VAHPLDAAVIDHIRGSRDFTGAHPKGPIAGWTTEILKSRPQGHHKFPATAPAVRSVAICAQYEHQHWVNSLPEKNASR